MSLPEMNPNSSVERTVHRTFVERRFARTLSLALPNPICSTYHLLFACFGLEKLHLSPKNRGVSDCTVFLGCLEAALLASTGVLVRLSKVDEGCVVADDLTREAALCRHGGGSLVSTGSLGRVAS
jgi:hypothetical protein